MVFSAASLLHATITMESNKRAAKNTDRLWGRPRWRGKELSARTFWLLCIGVFAVAIVAIYYIFKLDGPVS